MTHQSTGLNALLPLRFNRLTDWTETKTQALVVILDLSRYSQNLNHMSSTGPPWPPYCSWAPEQQSLTQGENECLLSVGQMKAAGCCNYSCVHLRARVQTGFYKQDCACADESGLHLAHQGNTKMKTALEAREKASGALRCQQKQCISELTVMTQIGH